MTNDSGRQAGAHQGGEIEITKGEFSVRVADAIVAELRDYFRGSSVEALVELEGRAIANSVLERLGI